MGRPLIKVAARELGITYPVLVGRRSVQELYGVSSSTTVVIDPRAHSAHTGDVWAAAVMGRASVDPVKSSARKADCY